MNREPRVIIIAGPCCAGKTTFAREFLPLDADCPRFINVDSIAEGLSLFAPQNALLPAHEVMQREIQRLIIERESFAFETTLAETDYAHSIPKWQAAGYRVKLIFLHLDRPDLVIARAAQRALFSGLTASGLSIRSDWATGFRNFETLYAPLVDSWALYDTSGIEPVLLDWNTKSVGPSAIDGIRDQDLRFSLNALQRATAHLHEMALLTDTPIIVSRNGVLEQISAGLEQLAITIHEPASTYLK